VTEFEIIVDSVNVRGQLVQSRRIFRFEFKPQDTQLAQTVFDFIWPIQ